MVSLNLLELFIIIFFVIFLVVLFYAVIRRCCTSVSKTNPAGVKRSKKSSVGSANADQTSQARNQRTAARQNTQTIYLGTSNEVGHSGSRSIYTIPINSLDLTRTSVVIVRNLNSSTSSNHNNTITLRIPETIVEEPPPSYEDCLRISSNTPNSANNTSNSADNTSNSPATPLDNSDIV